MAEARVIWNNALGMHINIVTSPADANIRAFGEDRVIIQEHLRRADPFDAGAVGITSYRLFGNLQRVDSIHAGGRYRTVNSFVGRGDTAVELFVFSDITQNREARARAAALHELGHALGFLEESPHREDVMFHTENQRDPNMVLTRQEIEHLAQIYRIRYRWQ